jgi:hypothetical protein
MKTLLQIGQFLRVIDDNGQLSITNLGMYIALYKLFIIKNPGFGEVGTYLLAAATYSFKKHLGSKDNDGSN